MGRPRRQASGLLLSALACAVLLGALAQLASAATPDSVSVPASARAARRYWTPARMRSAVPVLAKSRPSRRLVHAADDAGGDPEEGGTHSYPSRSPTFGAGSSSAAEAIADPTVPGSSQNGAVFIVSGDGSRGRCSGTSLNGPNYSLVITAGHCVHFFGRWLSGRWIFVPGYHFGQRPFGTFAAKWLGTTEQWRTRENENYDVGIAVVSRNERGQRLADAVGGDGIAWGLPRQQVFDVYGYPVEPPFNGATLQRCPQAPYEGHDFLSFLSPGPLDLGVQCDVTPGSSGGAWVISGDTVNSVTSTGYEDDPMNVFGPYFGKAVGRLFKQAGRVR
ncbi:MAG: trypsin-like serine peptidase [Solirubrobacterales bacterium]